MSRTQTGDVPESAEVIELARKMAEQDYGPRTDAAFGMGWHEHDAQYLIWARKALRALTPVTRKAGAK